MSITPYYVKELDYMSFGMVLIVVAVIFILFAIVKKLFKIIVPIVIVAGIIYGALHMASLTADENYLTNYKGDNNICLKI